MGEGGAIPQVARRPHQGQRQLRGRMGRELRLGGEGTIAAGAFVLFVFVVRGRAFIEVDPTFLWAVARTKHQQHLAIMRRHRHPARRDQPGDQDGQQAQIWHEAAQGLSPDAR